MLLTLESLDIPFRLPQSLQLQRQNKEASDAGGENTKIFMPRPDVCSNSAHWRDFSRAAREWRVSKKKRISVEKTLQPQTSELVACTDTATLPVS